MKLLRTAVAMLAFATLVTGTSARAACPTFADQQTQANTAGSASAPVSGLAFAQYFIRVIDGGGTAAVFNFAISAVPGFSYSNGQRGFTGSGSTLYVSYLVGPTAVVGQYRDLVVEIHNSAGQLICSDTFRVTVRLPPGWTQWLNRDLPGGDGDFETLADFGPNLVCPNPVAVECQTTGGIPWYSTGQQYSCIPNQGGVCLNSQQSGSFCQDYQVRFYCP
ncbi:MAG: hypothetical protein EOO71_04590 [Myxococcaceae bacterium]|nr:MAG: hypothetical protein EOO71_04590 [Myxococcaceae bacterium]